ncbi:hypothetical protein [Clostridium beijerinckii]|uniref:Uncharacterized protein n=1 Tax=Clostridium beijerinckii TaxID=1520 RepID=A0AAW3W840_CLOBE|nr:hypothetical protein [Clostridium beijerinckii]MBC2457522.1 hypothetical protein [Clostridium beijerinckii]MBC2474653.1 hypothetical protein [Clostridium beijerinckii]NOV62390.1 hypothetical protein [Clostridium beijerinckii]NOV68113.1 hypothetical protein [Clostridium beijerinckii]NOW30442.1 hypothetical protein [Clostridium beijerinckii]
MDEGQKDSLLRMFKYYLTDCKNNLENFSFKFNEDILEISGKDYYLKNNYRPILNVKSITHD